MISRKFFLECVATLEAYFEKKIQPEAALGVWFKYFNERLDDDDLKAAVEQVIVNCRFMPTPKEVVEFVQLDNELNAKQEWEFKVVPAAKMSSEDGRTHYTNQLSKRGRIALSMVGGLDKIAQSEEKFLGVIEKDFKKIYCQTSASEKTLPPAKPEPKLHQAEDAQPILLTPTNPEIQKILERVSKFAQGEKQPIEEVYRASLNANGWQIGEGRFNYFLENVEDKTRFLADFKFQIKQGKSPMVAFDNLSGYEIPQNNYDQKAVASEWLQEVEF